MRELETGNIPRFDRTSYFMEFFVHDKGKTVVNLWESYEVLLCIRKANVREKSTD